VLVSAQHSLRARLELASPPLPCALQMDRRLARNPRVLCYRLCRVAQLRTHTRSCPLDAARSRDAAARDPCPILRCTKLNFGPAPGQPLMLDSSICDFLKLCIVDMRSYTFPRVRVCRKSQDVERGWDVGQGTGRWGGC
jgi:hypothetical protein